MRMGDVGIIPCFWVEGGRPFLPLSLWLSWAPEDSCLMPLHRAAWGPQSLLA